MTHSTAAPIKVEQLAGRWNLDTTASEIRIAHRAMWGLLNVKGPFSSFSGTGSVQADGSVTGSISIEAASLNTKNKTRDEHLRSPDFFDVNRYPDITIQISDITVQGNQAAIHATLTVKDIREQLTLSAQIQEATVDSVTLTTDARIDRNHFGMSWNRMGNLVGLTTVHVTAVFHQDPA